MCYIQHTDDGALEVCLEAAITVTRRLTATHQWSSMGAPMRMLLSRAHNGLLECIVVGIALPKTPADTMAHYALVDFALISVLCKDFPNMGNLGRHRPGCRMEVHGLD